MTIKQLTTVVEQAGTLKEISQAYTEIASSKLKRIRNAVVKNRYFLDDLAKVYVVVKQVANQRHILLKSKYQKPISLLITSNYHFYGNVNNELIKYFTQQMIKQPTDQIIIGKTALEWLKGSNYSLPYESYILKSDYPSIEELTALVTKLKDYAQVLIYYSELKTVMVQQPTFKDITQTASLHMQVEQQKQQEQDFEKLFIFEPEIEKILDFFNNQVTNLLLQQTFLESELSRTASRLISMDQAQTNADKYISEQKRLLATAKRSQVNEKLIETYTALAGIRKQGYDEM